MNSTPEHAILSLCIIYANSSSLTGLLTYGTVYLIKTAESVNSFKSRLDKFWKHQELMYNYRSELHGTGSRSEFNL